MLRVCDVCGLVDEEPRHQIVYRPGEAPAVDDAVRVKVLEQKGLDPQVRLACLDDLAETSIQLRHPACCHRVGCPTGICEE